jgi:hypothetical protein
MSDLSRIPGLQESSLELLEVAGVSDLESLATEAPDKLADELQRANGVLKLAGITPGVEEIEEWVRCARKLTGRPELVEEVRVAPVDHERNPEVAELLAKAPFAIPLPARQLVDYKLAVSDIPAAILLNRYSGDLDVRVSDRTPGHKPAKPITSGYVQVAEPVQQRMEIDTSRVKTTVDYDAVPRAPKPAPAPVAAGSPAEEDRVTLIRTTRERTNRGVDPSSRRYVRGVLHSHPYSMRFGAFITLVTMMVLPVAIVSGLLLLLSDQKPETFGWVPGWLLVFPAVLPLLGLLFLIWGLKGSCRICGQRLFVPRDCLKNSKAHHVPGLGYILPVSFHMLVFRWFRCTYCGTPVRLKK